MFRARIHHIVAVAALVGLVASAGATAATKPTVTIGTKNFTEQYILGQLYKQTLEAKGYKVQFKGSIGSSELIDTALTSGKINFYPEYTGVIVADLFHKTFSGATAAATTAEAKKLEGAKGFTVLNPTPFYDTDVIAVTNATAKKYGLQGIGDLKKVGSYKFAGFPECQTRNTCLLGYEKQYGICNPTFVPPASISAYTL